MAERTCSVDNCERKVRASGRCYLHHEPRRQKSRCSITDCHRPEVAVALCTVHYRRLLRHGDPLGGEARRFRGRVCSLDGCQSPHMALGYCKLHYDRFRSNGTTEPQRPGTYKRSPTYVPWNKGSSPKYRCEVCECVFTRHGGLSHKKRFCSNDCQGRFFTGPNHPRWRGGVEAPSQRDRKTLRYRQWRKAVFERDDYTCLLCGRRGGRLHADHIKSWSSTPELRFDVDNGRALCVPCHMATPTWGRG